MNTQVFTNKQIKYIKSVIRIFKFTTSVLIIFDYKCFKIFLKYFDQPIEIYIS